MPQKADKETSTRKRVNRATASKKSVANHPFFLKKAKEAKAFLKKSGLPKEIEVQHYNNAVGSGIKTYKISDNSIKIEFQNG